MTNTIDIAVSYDTLKTQAKEALVSVGKTYLSTVKTVGLYRAALTLRNPKHGDDPAVASSEAFNLCKRWLVQGGVTEADAKGIANNAKGASDLACKVLTEGLSERIYNAVPTSECSKAAKAVTAETVGDLNKLKLTKAGRLTAKAKDAFGITPKPKAEVQQPKEPKNVTPIEDGDLSDDKALTKCFNLLTEIQQVSKNHLCDESKRKLRSEMLTVMSTFLPSVDEDAA